ncbi:signal transduction histidine kinase [Alkalibaculum bacchi]|uniref:histidine kinase n=2 Tax=Alkalibaculum bacchi TaxID=645887 RepID=A0A366I949_9FIRM|nr:signal transduction histidine kinase [Alkalibaculum bacchi]
MDGQSYKKVIRYIIIWLILVTVLSIGIGIMVKKGTQVYHMQMDEMIIFYPEQQQVLEESFEYYITEMKIITLHFWLFLIAVSIMSFSLCYCIQISKDRKKKCENKNDLKRISEQLEQFKKGNYRLVPSLISMESHNNKTNEWMKIEDLLRELGYYFTTLREQLDREENGTKSLITDISHQLKTPLSSLRMSHELAQEAELTHEERRQFLLMEEQEINKLEILLEELVHLSRLENHMIEIKPELSGIKKTLSEAINQVYMKAYSKDIKIQIDIKNDVNVKHDPKWTVEAISNVLDNAIKYSNAGSCVSIGVHKLPNLVMIDIEDEGMGIPTEELHRIFQRFYRGKSASSQVKEGAGIGLYLTRKIIDEQGGMIVAKRKLHNGTIFRITLPI